MSVLAAKPYKPVLYIDTFDHCLGVDYGDPESVPEYIDESFHLIEDRLAPVFKKNVLPVAIGGDHSVSLPELRGCSKTYGEVALVHFDAHYGIFFCATS